MIIILLSLANIAPNFKSSITFKDEWELLTKATQHESKGEPFIGQLFVAQLMINRQEGCKCSIEEVLSKRFHSNPNYLKNIQKEVLDTHLMKKLRILDNVKIHNFWYFYNPETATDKQFIKAMKKKKNKLVIYNHIFIEK